MKLVWVISAAVVSISTYNKKSRHQFMSCCKNFQSHCCDAALLGFICFQILLYSSFFVLVTGNRNLSNAQKSPVTSAALEPIIKRWPWSSSCWLQSPEGRVAFLVFGFNMLWFARHLYYQKGELNLWPCNKRLTIVPLLYLSVWALILCDHTQNFPIICHKILQFAESL